MSQNVRTGLGVSLIVAGLLLIGQQMDLIGGNVFQAMMLLVFAAGAIFFANIYREDRSNWWAVMVTLIFLGFATSQFLEIFFPAISGSIVGASVLFLAGFAFLTVFLQDRSMWWAIIPAGTLFSLTAVVIADDFLHISGFETGGLLFLGLSLTFMVLTVLPTEGEKLTWAVFPALVLLALGIFVTFEESELWNIIWPSLIILLGIYFIIGAFRRS